MRFIVLAVALTAGNFAYQAFGHQDWSVATERSWFQAIAVGATWAMLALTSAYLDDSK